MNGISRKIFILTIIISLLMGFGGGVALLKYQYASSLPIIKKLVNQEVGKPQDVDFALFWHGRFQTLRYFD